MTALRWFLNFAILYHLAAIIALLLTGGYALEVGAIEITSTRADPLLLGLFVSAVLRIAVHLGWRDSLLLALSTGFALGIAEIVLRIFEPPIANPALMQITRASDRFEFELIPGARGTGQFGEEITINDFGARDREFAPKGANHRIVALGDSFTFGFGVGPDDGYARVLETLRESEVLNLGVPSYQLWHHVAQLEDRVPALEPDLVLIGFFQDDLVAPLRPADVHARNPFEARVEGKFTASLLWNALRNVGARMEYRFRYQRGHDYVESIEARKRYLRDEPDVRYLYDLQTGNLDAGAKADIAGAVARIKGWSVANGVPVMGAFIPDASQLGEPERQFPNRFLAEVFERHQLPFIDVTPVFEAIDDPRSLYLFPIDAHTSPVGHKLIAETIAAAIE